LISAALQCWAHFFLLEQNEWGKSVKWARVYPIYNQMNTPGVESQQ
jgi:hypothetical protein